MQARLVVSAWSASKAVLILATHLPQITIGLADVVHQEAQHAFARKAALSATADGEAAHAGWLARVRLERRPLPTEQEIARLAPAILPVLRHVNDLPVVVSAIAARPDYVLSTNVPIGVRHWQTGPTCVSSRPVSSWKR
ncbi:MAG: hypothetical protein ACR2JY_13615 [Chloroflexota bacterium]